MEIDNLWVMSKCIMNLEVKSATAKDGPEGQNQMKNLLEKVSKQNAKVNRTFLNSQKDILDASWSFVRAVALPNIEKKSLAGVCCDYCADFVLDKNGLENFDKWVADFLENLDSKTPDSSSVYHNSEAYKKLFRRLVGFYSLSDSHRYYLLDLVLVHIIFLLYLF
jgi:hypothetical protein